MKKNTKVQKNHNGFPKTIYSKNKRDLLSSTTYRSIEMRKTLTVGILMYINFKWYEMNVFFTFQYYFNIQIASPFSDN